MPNPFPLIVLLIIPQFSIAITENDHHRDFPIVKDEAPSGQRGQGIRNTGSNENVRTISFCEQSSTAPIEKQKSPKAIFRFKTISFFSRTARNKNLPTKCYEKLSAKKRSHSHVKSPKDGSVQKVEKKPILLELVIVSAVCFLGGYACGNCLNRKKAHAAVPSLSVPVAPHDPAAAPLAIPAHS